MSIRTLLLVRFIFFLVISLLTGASCSLNTVYSNLDYLIPAYIDNLVDLDELEDRADSETILLLIWHQKHQLPKYNQFLTEIKYIVSSENNKKIQSEEILLYLQKTSSLWHQMRAQLSIHLAELLPLLSTDQIQELFASLEENNEKFIKTNIGLDKNEQVEIYDERLISNFEDWFGYLTKEQRKQLSKAAKEFQSLSRQRLTARLEWQQQTKKLLFSDEPDKTKLLLKLFNRLSLKHDNLYANINAINRKVLITILSYTFKTLEIQQKRHLVNKLDDYIELIDSFKKHKWIQE